MININSWSSAPISCRSPHIVDTVSAGTEWHSHTVYTSTNRAAFNPQLSLHWGTFPCLHFSECWLTNEGLYRSSVCALCVCGRRRSATQRPWRTWTAATLATWRTWSRCLTSPRRPSVRGCASLKKSCWTSTHTSTCLSKKGRTHSVTHRHTHTNIWREKRVIRWLPMHVSERRNAELSRFRYACDLVCMYTGVNRKLMLLTINYWALILFK